MTRLGIVSDSHDHGLWLERYLQLCKKEKYDAIDGIYPSLDKLKKDISTQYIILIDGAIDNDFIRKAILHYQYLDKDIAIAEGSDKFSLSAEKGIENKVIPLRNHDLIEDGEIKVYYI